MVALEKGPTLDEFFLTFEVLGSATHVVVEASPAPPPPPLDVPRDPDFGIRDFAEINQTMSNMTGVPTTQAQVKATYDAVYQALPVSTGIEGFLSSQQMGITQLAISYCSALVEDTSKRATFFPGFNFSAGVSTAFDSGAKQNQIIDPLHGEDGRREHPHAARRRSDARRGRQPDCPSRRLQWCAVLHQRRGERCVCFGARQCRDVGSVTRGWN